MTFRMCDIERKTSFVSRDIVFDETIFPFRYVSTPESLFDPFPDLVVLKPVIEITSIFKFLVDRLQSPFSF